ncbi:MAG: GNAT family N-acetyltransferase [Alphaproteobacteria bacterium]|nr:GNAT family N-acetyltransferase [Alphaproteobacteria bacterium]
MQALREHFSPTCTIKYAHTREDFARAACRSPLNFGLFTTVPQYRPLQFAYAINIAPKIIPDEKLRYFYIQKGGLVRGCGTLLDRYPDNNSNGLSDISVHKNFQGKGYGKFLLWACLLHTYAQKRDLHPSFFMPMGAERLGSFFAKVHGDFPDLRVFYNEYEQPVTGRELYRLDIQDGVTHVIHMD